MESDSEFLDRIKKLRAAGLRETAQGILLQDAKIKKLRNANHQLRIRLLAFISRYDRDHPMRTADFHDPDCGCLRCERDRAAALLAQGETDGK